MPLYTYKAVRPDGEVREGELEAADEAALVRSLQAEGLIPIRTRPAGGLSARLFQGRRKVIGRKEIGFFTRELATLLEAGLTLDHSLQTLRELAAEERIARLLEDLQERVRGGATFSEALEAQQNAFPPLYLNMVRAGEAGGALDAVLVRLADYLERSEQLHDSVKSALIYPTILLLVAGLSVIMLLVVVVPQFAQMFDDMGAALPLPTRIVVATGDLFRNYWWLMLSVAAGGAALLQKWLRQPQARERWDARVLKLPLFGELAWKLQTSRLCHTLETLLENGLPLLNALTLAREVVTNRYLANLLRESGEDLKRGKSLADALGAREILPRLALQMIRVGEESGTLEAMLGKVAGIYERETRSSVQRLLSLLEPVLIIGLGIVVAGIIMSILVAILGANELVF